MPQKPKTPPHPGFVVLRRLDNDLWEMLGEVRRQPGKPARAARSQAVLEASNGSAKAGDVYAAVLRSEWTLAMDWDPPES